VGTSPGDESVYGVMDMAGNVMEWVDTWYGPDAREIRGGSWNTGSYAVRAASRAGRPADEFFFDVGFRCAYPPP
jgi:formylglycine-generating enzyme required for sulfatase activity